MGWPIEMELKGCESIECWTRVVTFKVPLTDSMHSFFLEVSLPTEFNEAKKCQITKFQILFC